MRIFLMDFERFNYSSVSELDIDFVFDYSDFEFKFKTKSEIMCLIARDSLQALL